MSQKSAFDTKEEAMLFRDEAFRQGDILGAFSYAGDCDTFFGVCRDPRSNTLAPFAMTRDCVKTQIEEWRVSAYIESMSRGKANGVVVMDMMNLATQFSAQFMLG